MTARGGIAGRLLLAQLLVLLVAAATLAVTVALLAPGLFAYHLRHAGEDSPIVQQHAQEAFEITLGIALAAAAAVSLATAAALFWLLARRIGRPLADLAAAAESIAQGDYAVAVPAGGYGRELTTLAGSFQRMADRLQATDAARARMLADLAHEIRTPLATIEAHVDALEDGIVPAGPETYSVMRAQVDRLRRLAGDIRLAAEAQEHALRLVLRPEPVAGMLRAAADAASARYDAKGVELRRGQCPTAAMALADADRIGQVLANLLDNALRHTPPGGRVDLACQQQPGQAVITVADTGEGIPHDQLEAVFDRFHRADPARTSREGGSGLGLTIARAIADQHGGTLTAHSPAPGTGTGAGTGTGTGTIITLRIPAG